MAPQNAQYVPPSLVGRLEFVAAFLAIMEVVNNFLLLAWLAFVAGVCCLHGLIASSPAMMPLAAASAILAAVVCVWRTRQCVLVCALLCSPPSHLCVVACCAEFCRA